jgi:hypothetical protein
MQRQLASHRAVKDRAVDELTRVLHCANIAGFRRRTWRSGYHHLQDIAVPC